MKEKKSERSEEKPRAARTAALEFETARGFRELEVHYKKVEALDVEAVSRLEPFKELFGKKETIRIYQTRAKEIPNYHVLFCGNDMEAFAEFLCRKPAGWGELLTPESIIALTDPEKGIGPEVNRSLWQAWFRGVTKRNEMLMPGSIDTVAKTFEHFVEILKRPGSPLADSSSKPQSG